MKNLRIYFTSGLAALAVVSALFLLSFESSPPPNLKQKFEAVAKSYLTHHYNQNLAGTQRTLLTNANLDAKVIQLINAVAPKRKFISIMCFRNTKTHHFGQPFGHWRDQPRAG